MNTRSALAGETDIEASANDAIVAVAASLLPYLRTHVGMSMWLITRKQGDLCEVVVAEGTGYRLRNGDVLRWDESPCSALTDGQSRFLACTSDAPEFEQSSFVRRLRVGAFLCVPLKRSSGELIGALWALDPEPVDPSIRDVLPFLEVQAILVGQLLEKSEEALRHFERAEVAERESTIDSLTGALNQRGLEAAVVLAERRSRRYGGSVSALRFALDHLDYVQRNLGIAAEDAYIELFANIVSKTVRVTDCVARVGRGEFVVLLPNTDSLGAEALRRRIQARLDDAGVVVAVASAERDFDGEGVMGAIARAEAELRTCLGQPTDDESAPPISLMMHLSATELSAHTLREAISNREFHVRYQPIFEVSTGRPIGVDARVHWTSSAIGEVSPDIFMSAIEGVGLASELGEYFRDLVFRVARRLPTHSVVTIRPLRSELVSDRFAEQFLAAVRRSGLQPERFAVEVSLPLSFSANADVLLTLGMLRHAGVRVIFDGLGLHPIDGADLLDLPVDVLKIDHSLTAEIGRNAQVPEKICELVNFARSFGLGTIIDGIETAEEFAIIRTSGCEFVQGHLIGPAMTTDRLLARLSSIES